MSCHPDPPGDAVEALLYATGLRPKIHHYRRIEAHRQMQPRHDCHGPEFPAHVIAVLPTGSKHTEETPRSADDRLIIGVVRPYKVVDIDDPTPHHACERLESLNEVDIRTSRLCILVLCGDLRCVVELDPKHRPISRHPLGDLIWTCPSSHVPYRGRRRVSKDQSVSNVQEHLALWTQRSQVLAGATDLHHLCEDIENSCILD